MKMQKIGILVLVLLIWQQMLYSQDKKFTIAVPDFQNHSLLKTDHTIDALKYGLADVLITALASCDQLMVVERRQLKDILAEQRLALTGILDDSTARRAGRLLGARYLLLGSYMCGLKNDIRIDCRIVNAETGETVQAEEISGKLDELIGLAEKLNKKVLKQLDVKLSSQVSEKFKSSYNLCTNQVLQNYFRVLWMLENNDLQSAEELLEQILMDCPQFKRAANLKQQLRSQH